MTDERGRIDEKLDQAIGAVADLVREVLEVRSSSCFAEAIRFCSVGQILQASRRRTAEDYMNQEKQIRMYGNLGIANPVAPYDIADPIPVPQNGGGMPDQHQLIRDVLGAVGPYFQTLSKNQEAQTSSNELSELASLKNLLEHMPPDSEAKAMLEARVSKLMKNVQERYADDDVEPLPLVPADLPRRHPPRVNLDERDEAPSLRADGDRADGDDVPSRARAEEDADARSVG